MTQPTLFDPQLKPKIEPVDPHLTPEEKPRLTKQCIKTLEMLRGGAVTNMQFVYAGILRYSARIHDLRHAGYEIETDQDRGTGLTTFTLLREPR